MTVKAEKKLTNTTEFERTNEQLLGKNLCICTSLGNTADNKPIQKCFCLFVYFFQLHTGNNVYAAADRLVHVCGWISIGQTFGANRLEKRPNISTACRSFSIFFFFLTIAQLRHIFKTNLHTQTLGTQLDIPFKHCQTFCSLPLLFFSSFYTSIIQLDQFNFCLPKNGIRNKP